MTEYIYKGRHYKAVVTDTPASCEGCAFRGVITDSPKIREYKRDGCFGGPPCHALNRKDHTTIIWKEA